MAKAKITTAQLYTGRTVSIRYRGKVVKGEVSNGDQCSEREFAFSDGDELEMCVARSAIVELGR